MKNHPLYTYQTSRQKDIKMTSFCTIYDSLADNLKNIAGISNKLDLTHSILDNKSINVKP